MFHIKTLELVHWDYWQRFVLPLDAQIITIVGPNGSGKTTLLDALRTLFALRCSGKRDFRRYVRRAERSFAWIRAVVANAPGVTGRRPFFPCLSDEVTLVCRIRRAGGDWTRDYAILDADVPVEDLEQNEDWIGLRDYQNRLAFGGLTPAIAKVLALEQGDTDKLCEYSPKALLELVFDVFGDKEVLDNYRIAREEQKNTERELAELNLELERLRAQVQARAAEANQYLDWKRLEDERVALESEIIPRLTIAELSSTAQAERQELSRIQRERNEKQAAQRTLQGKIAATDQEREVAQAQLAKLKAAHAEAEAAHQTALLRVHDLEKTLAESERLRARVAAEHGQNALALEAAYEAAERNFSELRRQDKEALAAFEEKSEQLRAARTQGSRPSDPEVARFRSMLDEAGIAHQSLSQTLEVLDPHWQGALEAVLRPYRHVILLENAEDRHAAWALGERERFRHFIVPEREMPPPAVPGSLAEVVRFDTDVPRWVADLLNRIKRVKSIEAAQKLPKEQEWITPEAYHRERRGARHLGKPHDFYFGELARSARIAQLESDIAELDAARKKLVPQREAAQHELESLRARLLGLQSAQLLLSRATEFAEAQQNLPLAQAALTAAIEARVSTQSAWEAQRENINGIDIEKNKWQSQLNELSSRLNEIARTHGARRHAQAERWVQYRALRRGMLEAWLDGEDLVQLSERYEGAAGARREAQRLQKRLEEGDWVTEVSVLTLRDHVKAELEKRERDYGARQAYCETARRHTQEAREAYMAKLRATVRQYGKNLRALGELAGLKVEAVLPSLEDEDIALANAGLEVRFDFDSKGAVGLNDGEASGGQQVMKSLILLIALLMDEARPGGFVFIDEPFAHLDVANIDRVGSFLRATRAQYLITTPVTHNANVFAPAQLTLVTRKKSPQESWAPPIGVLQRTKH